MSRTFFTDRDLGKAFPRRLANAGILVEPHHAHFRPDAPDPEWLTEVGRHGWYVFTHDRRIRYKPNEKAAVLSAGLGLFVVVGKLPMDALARNVIATMDKIERFIDRHRVPFIAKVYCPSGCSVANAGQRSGRVEMWLSEGH